MSSKLVLSASITFTAALAIGFLGMKSYDDQQAVLQKVPPLQKMRTSLAVKLKSVEDIPFSNNQEITLQAEVTSMLDHNSDFSYQWDLPVGVSVLSGERSDQNLSIAAGETKIIQISVTGFAQEEFKTIGVSAHLNQGETLIGNSAVITSSPSESLAMLSEENSTFATGFRKTASLDDSGARKKRPLLEGKLLR
jgi:hypothetical protein